MKSKHEIKIANKIPSLRTICAFGEACSWPVQSFAAKFKDEFVAKGAADEERRSKEKNASIASALPEATLVASNR